MSRRNPRFGGRPHAGARRHAADLLRAGAALAILCIPSPRLAFAQQEAASRGAAAGAPPDSAAAVDSAPAAPHAPKTGPAPAKTLEITTIEGQILFPKVLFISSEDPARYPETFHRTYLGTALGLGRSAPFPKHIQVDTISSEAPVPDAPAAPTPDAPEPATPSPIPPEVNP